MAICVNETSQKLLFVKNTPASSCQGFIVIDKNEYDALVESYSIAPADVAYVWMWGFGSIIIPWSLTYAAKWAQKSINLLG